MRIIVVYTILNMTNRFTSVMYKFMKHNYFVLTTKSNKCFFASFSNITNCKNQCL